MHVPLVDLQGQYRQHKLFLDYAVNRVIKSSQFVGGKIHQEFKNNFADFCGGGHVALCGNGTDALWLAIMSILGPGDGKKEIITVAHTFIATAEAIVNAGYKPVFIDIRPDTYLMDPSRIQQAITKQTRAIIPIHLYGQMCEMDRIMSVARAHGLKVIEDAAQAHGAQYQNHSSGCLSDAACYSFYPGKNLGAYGDGGAVYSRNKKVIDNVIQRANHGRVNKYEHNFVGINSRLDTIQASILNAKLKWLHQWNAQRREAAQKYSMWLDGLQGVVLPQVHKQAYSVYHLYVIQIEDRGRVLDALRRSGVGAGIHYPIPLHLQPALRHIEHPHDLSITEELCRKIISLPIYPEITSEQINYVVECLAKAVAHG